MSPKYCKWTQVLMHAYKYIFNQFIRCLENEAAGDRKIFLWTLLLSKVYFQNYFQQVRKGPFI